ncbi:MAG: hypothetical protein ACYCST_16920 [Acidimicrobiales bacterium]
MRSRPSPDPATEAAKRSAARATKSARRSAQLPRRVGGTLLRFGRTFVFGLCMIFAGLVVFALVWTTAHPHAPRSGGVAQPPVGPTNLAAGALLVLVLVLAIRSAVQHWRSGGTPTVRHASAVVRACDLVGQRYLGWCNPVTAWLFRRSRRRDEGSWRTWRSMSALPPPPLRPWSNSLVFGQVVWVTQRARRGTKVNVHFVQIGMQDTWWPWQCPRKGTWVLVRAHLWVPPGTHSGRDVWWIDSTEGAWPRSLARQARRHERRITRENTRSSRAPSGTAAER